MKSRIIPVVLTAALTSLGTLFLAARYQHNIPFIAAAGEHPQLPVNYAAFNGSTAVNATPPVDFQLSAEGSVKAVVHIKTKTKPRTITASDPYDDFFGNIFGQRQYYMPPQMGSGSGVVISPDGYIVTNNHVVAGADELTVTFNDRYTKSAKVIGTDAATDIAILKVDEKSLPYMEFGNSDEVKLGQWVLAVGYPLTLDATVTAGIVSAKSRAIGINRTQSKSAIESFIQTDAAVNPGNSGGALVNVKGQLIGINSAIASPTGSYAGYSYAIPSNIVRKVANDLMQYGTVQRGYLGIEYLDRSSATPEQLANMHIDRADGVYVTGVRANSGAVKAGIQKGDMITQINGVAIRTEPEMLEQVARYKPGDNVSITYLRNGQEKTGTVELKSLDNSTGIVRQGGNALVLGATFRPLSEAELRTYRSELSARGASNGLVITDPGTGLLAKKTSMKKGFVLIGVNDRQLSTAADLQAVLAQSEDQVQFIGFYPGQQGNFYFTLSGIPDADKLQ